MAQKKDKSMDTKFAIVPVRVNSTDESKSLKEEGIDLNSDSAFLQQTWQLFAQWRASLREDKNILLQRSMEETDALISACMRNGVLGDEEKMLEYMSLFNNHTGMMQRIKQINTIVQYFKKNYRTIAREMGNGHSD